MWFTKVPIIQTFYSFLLKSIFPHFHLHTLSFYSSSFHHTSQKNCLQIKPSDFWLSALYIYFPTHWFSALNFYQSPHDKFEANKPLVTFDASAFFKYSKGKFNFSLSHPRARLCDRAQQLMNAPYWFISQCKKKIDGNNKNISLRSEEKKAKTNREDIFLHQRAFNKLRCHVSCHVCMIYFVKNRGM